MAKRLNIVLPEDTVRVLDRITKPGERSRFIAEAIEHYVRTVGRAGLRERLKQGALTRADRDRELAGEWFSLEHDAWPDDRRRGQK